MAKHMLNNFTLLFLSGNKKTVLSILKAKG